MRTEFRFSLISSMIAAVGGCAAYSPAPLDPRAELESLRARNLQFVEITRLSRFDDENSTDKFDLNDGVNEPELVSIALTLNPSLQSRRAEVGEAQALLISAGQWPNPTFDAGFRPGIGGTSGYAINADAMFELLWSGQRDALKQSAAARGDQVNAEILAAEYALVADVRQQRLSVLAADRNVALLQEAINLREKSHGLVQEQRRLGEGTELDLSAVELDLAEARRELRKAELELDSARRELNRLLGLPPEYSLQLSGIGEPLAINIYEDLTDAELDERLLAGRSELRAKEAAYQQSEQEFRLAVLRQYPQFNIGPSYERDVDGSNSLGIGLSIELPILNQNQGEIAEKRAARERERAEYVELLHRLRADAFASRAEVRAARAEVDAQESEILPLLRRTQALFERAYRSGDLNIIDLITAEQRSLNAQRENLNALVEYRKALIKLESTLGQQMHSPTTLPTNSSK